MNVPPYPAPTAMQLADLSRAAVHAIDDRFYAPAGKAPWAPASIDYRFRGRLADTRPPSTCGVCRRACHAIMPR